MRNYLLAGAAVASAILAGQSSADPISDADLQAAFAELEALKKSQLETAARIRAIEGKLLGVEALGEVAAGNAVSEKGEPGQDPAPNWPVIMASSPTRLGRLSISGDMLFRSEGNYTDGKTSASRERSVMRARLGAIYAVNDRLTVGGLLETGDPDDPNSGYLTLSNFADDLQVSLSRAYASYDYGGTTLFAGKFEKPFMSTDLLWDGDVNPVGVAGRSRIPVSASSDLNLSGILFVVDENAMGEDSHMFGTQAHLQSTWSPALKTDVALAYYAYDLGSVGGADVGDFRTNLLRPDGSYVSDFELLDLVAKASWSGMSEQWPVALTVNYVTNTGAAVDDDTALGVDLNLGRSSQPHDILFAYGYGEAEVDSVLAAFSHDNYSFATNYMAHEFAAQYVLTENVSLSASLYHYKPLRSAYAGTFAPGDWLDRVRLNLAISF